MPADWQLEAVYGIGVLETRMPTMEWRSFTPLRDGRQTLTITSEALLRPEQIKMAFAGDNGVGVLAARIEIRNTAASSWHQVYQGVFYRLHGSDGVLRNPPRPRLAKRCVNCGLR